MYFCHHHTTAPPSQMAHSKFSFGTEAHHFHTTEANGPIFSLFVSSTMTERQVCSSVLLPRLHLVAYGSLLYRKQQEPPSISSASAAPANPPPNISPTHKRPTAVKPGSFSWTSTARCDNLSLVLLVCPGLSASMRSPN
jgi:hypothetical protein